MQRYVGIDVGAETLKVVELERRAGRLHLRQRALVEHHKDPETAIRSAFADWDWNAVRSAAVVGRLGRMVALRRIPLKQALATGFRFVHGDREATIVSIGSHGFSVLELRPRSIEVFRENSRCSQGTGNFLRQLVERFNLTVEQASAMCVEVDDPAPLSGRCPVILKTDMTHLANKGTSHARILAGLYDAVCENVQVLIKPSLSPKDMALAGGVTQSERVRRKFARFAADNDMNLLARVEEDLYLEAIGCAVLAAEQHEVAPAINRLIARPPAEDLERVPSLAAHLGRVRRMPRQTLPETEVAAREVLVGLDIGSTGSKAVAVDRATGEALWEGYLNTNGDPVGAARKLMAEFAEGVAGKCAVVACGATGSGREIVGSLLATCYGTERVFVLNEIAAHAEGALHFDPSVDTIFEIGGQDAKYIRLAGGRVVDAAMNEACSAGTGSFIAEQGRKFAGVRDVVHLGEEALSAEEGVSLGQHCSVFMAEIIDEAVGAGVPTRSVIAGIYDSIIQNYLNRVKGSRSVGQVVFCQGMPFASDALAAAVARQTGSRIIIPPNPGTVGALGIALLARKELRLAAASMPLDPAVFLSAEVTAKEVFICKSNKGCGGAGNRCRIDRLATRVSGERQRFTWGGSCSLWDKGTGKQKLPDLAPDPFSEREALVQAIIDRVTVSRGRPTIAITDEFQLKDAFPFFATFFYELDCDLVYERSAGQGTLKRGIEEANTPFCAPMQLYHGLGAAMAETRAERIFAPMIRTLPRAKDESVSVVCPIAQAGADIVKLDLPGANRSRIFSPVVDFGEGRFRSAAFLKSCHAIAQELGMPGLGWVGAYLAACDAQEAFEHECHAIGERTLSFCETRGVIPVVVLGRTYTIYNTVLNSNVPALLREQGAIAIPTDCYLVDPALPSIDGVFWGFGQRNLRAAHQIRRRPSEYSLWCSNYACGPDSFNIHFYAYAMEGKPFAIIETDGHSGDAGTKTRIEAFLHCVRQHRSVAPTATIGPLHDLKNVERSPDGLETIRRNGEHVLIPRMGPNAELFAACLRGSGVAAEALPLPDKDALRRGRRQTSGKECLPMVITAGSLLQRLDASEPDQRFAFLMPTADGPCRFGVYNMLHRIILERVGESHRVRIWSPSDSNYFEGLGPGFSALAFTAFVAGDILLDALFDVRPVETIAGRTTELYEQYTRKLIALLEHVPQKQLSVHGALVEVATGRLFGVAELLRRAGTAFRAIKSERQIPTVGVVGEIYVRLDPFANDFLVEKLEARGLRARMAPFTEWLEYSDWLAWSRNEKTGLGNRLSSFVQGRIFAQCHALVAAALDWPERTSVRDSLDAAGPWVRDALAGEAVLTVGGSVHEWREGHIQGVVAVGPHECMPNKISEAQFFHVAESEGLASLTLAVNGDPIDPEVLDTFAFEIHQRAARGTDLRQDRGTDLRLPQVRPWLKLPQVRPWLRWSAPTKYIGMHEST